MKYFPKDYKAIIDRSQTEGAIRFIKRNFERELSGELKLSYVTAPLYVQSGSGINDDLTGVENAVKFKIKDLDNKNVEIVHSLAKWKRMILCDAKYSQGYGIYTDMNAIRADEVLDNIHSVYVDQWDWERVISKDEYNLDFLKKIVRKIYSAIKRTEFLINDQYPSLKSRLADDITFIHSEDAYEMYPNLSPEEREKKLSEKYGAIFIIGIGYTLKDNKPHGSRAPDYDNWSEATFNGHYGLNGDIILWDDIRKDSLEISSMGIRVNKDALLRQLKITKCEERSSLYWHKRLLNGDFPLTIGGGIGQSRICMYLLHKAHIAEVQSSVWGDDLIKEAAEKNISLL